MARTKTPKRYLAELISRRDGIKVGSAMSRITRAARSGKPLKGATRRQKELFRSLTFEVPVSRKAPKAPVFFERADLNFSGRRPMVLTAKVECGSTGSGDIRKRRITALVTADEANEILNADNLADAKALFMEEVPYIADIVRFDSFQIGSEVFKAGDFK